MNFNFIRTKWLTAIMVLLCGYLYAQDQQPGQNPVAIKYGETIKHEDLKKHLMILAGDEYEGRETGHPGQKKAAEYIESYFKSLGIPEIKDYGYQQEFPLVMSFPEGAQINIPGKAFSFMKDFYYFRGFSDTAFNVTELAFVGYGISDEKHDDYEGIDVKGKVVVFLEGEPMDKNGKYFLTGSEYPSAWSMQWRNKLFVAKEKGASAALIVVNDITTNLFKLKYYIERPSMSLESNQEASGKYIPSFYISSEMAKAIITDNKFKLDKTKKKINKKLRNMSSLVSAKGEIILKRKKEKLSSSNVLGFIEGRDVERKDEVIVITAHYDHLGKSGDEIFNGADDDGSGTVALLELAEAFTQAVKEGVGPLRSILIMGVSGEEKGLLGSEYYTENPIFPLKNTVANLNIDMIGRQDEFHENPNYIYLIGSDKLSSELHQISEKTNLVYTNLELDYKYNDPDDPNRFYYRSDHYNFAKNNVPVIFYFNGIHEDYHKPTDTPDKILYEKMTTITKLVFYTAWDLANRSERIKVDKVFEEIKE